MLGIITNLSKFKKFEIITASFQLELYKLEIKNRKNLVKLTNMQRINSRFLNTNGSKKKSKERYKNILRKARNLSSTKEPKSQYRKTVAYKKERLQNKIHPF
jgi:hypothetical protein